MMPTGIWKNINPTIISKTLKTIITSCGLNLGFEAKDVSALSLRAAGDIVLFCAGVDSNIIKLIGRWHSNEMLIYLHMQAEPLTRNFSKLMITQGKYSLLPQQKASCF